MNTVVTKNNEIISVDSSNSTYLSERWLSLSVVYRISLLFTSSKNGLSRCENVRNKGSVSFFLSLVCKNTEQNDYGMSYLVDLEAYIHYFDQHLLQLQRLYYLPVHSVGWILELDYHFLVKDLEGKSMEYRNLRFVPD